MTTKQRHDKLLHFVFPLLPISDTCTWYGTEWNGKEPKPCGEPTIGAGMFCDDNDPKWCGYHSLCERHSYGSERFDV